MAYATRALTLSYCGRLAPAITSTSVPSLTDLDTFIADRANVIDSALKSRGIQTPVAGPAELVAELAALNAKGAAGDAMQAAFLTSDMNDRGTGGIYLKEFADRIKQIIAGQGLAVGLSTAEQDLAPRYGGTDPQASLDALFATTNQQRPIFRLGQTF